VHPGPVRVIIERVFIAVPLCGGVFNVERDGKNTLEIKAIGVTISTFATRPEKVTH
jgi:hypothetical protein